jgi:hypothetical protein
VQFGWEQKVYSVVSVPSGVILKAVPEKEAFPPIEFTP